MNNIIDNDLPTQPTRLIRMLKAYCLYCGIRGYVYNSCRQHNFICYKCQKYRKLLKIILKLRKNQ